MRKEKGITLIALVITIIVLLILAGVTIVTLTGDNGLLQKATTAKEENEKAKELELIKLAVSAAQVAGEGTIKTDYLNTELRTNFNDNSININEIKDGWSFKSYRIDKKGNVDKLIPKEYQQVEYIESTGTQYINTLNSPIYNDIFTLEYSHSQITGSYRAIMGAASDGGNERIYISDFISSRYFGNIYFGKANIGEKYKYEFKLLKDEKSVLKINNTEVISSKLTAENLPMMLFARNITENRSIGKIHSFIWNRSGTTIRDFLPCKSTTTVADVDGIQHPKDTIGLYDTVEGKFYTNQGTGEFIAGPEV